MLELKVHHIKVDNKQAPRLFGGWGDLPYPGHGN